MFCSYSAFFILLLRFIAISFRKLKGPRVPTTVLRCATGSCNIYIVSRDNILTKPADSLFTVGKLRVHHIHISGNNLSLP